MKAALAWLRRRLPARAPAGAYSLRRRLTASVLGASVFMWVVCMAVVVHVAWRETSEVFDDALEEGARLALVLGVNLERQGALAGGEGERAEAPRAPAKLKLYYQIVGSDGRVWRRAEGAPDQPFSRELAQRHGYLNTWIDGRAWRIYVLRAEGRGFQVQIGQPWEERIGLLDEIAEELLWPALLLLALLGGFCWFVIRRLLRPIEHTAERIAAKSPADLQPVPSTGEPRELQPIVLAFNLVLSRLALALQAERRFTADAAHELRTPLAALRMRIQLLQRQRGAGAVEDLRSLRDDVDRCTSLVESLLALARLDPERPEALAREAVDMAAMFARLEAGAAPMAAERGVALVFGAASAHVSAHPALLQTALRNLLDNALRYGVPGGRVHIEAVDRGAAGVCVAVRDDGPGVPEADRARLTERFFRVLGTGEPGSGLGLSIVARVAALHGATLRFGPGLDGRGLGVLMDFPPH